MDSKNILKIPTEAELREEKILSSNGEAGVLDNDLEDPMSFGSPEEYENYLNSLYKI